MGKLEKIFLIYADADNSQVVHENFGWVDAFKYFLQVLLKQIAGWKIAFERIESFDKIKKIPSEYLLLIFFSKNLIEDEQQIRILKQVKDKVGKGKLSGDKILKIQKHYFQKELEPEYFHHFKDYSFYKANGLSESRSEYRDFFSNSEEKTFWVKLTDLAYEILSFTEKKGTGHLDLSNYSVFLAETNNEAENFRNNLKRDLDSMGLDIWPKGSFSESANDFILKLDKNIKNTDFAIHIVGNGFSPAIADTKHTKEEIQAKITENFSSLYKKNNSGAVYRRFFWFDKVGILTNERISNFYKQLSINVEEYQGTELVVSSWEEFKSLIYQFVSFELPNIKSKSLDDNAGDDGEIIYFLYDKVDEKLAMPLINALRKSGYKVITSNFDGDILAVRHIHMESLKRFDYAFIFSHNASLQWVNMKMLDVFKAPGFGREKPILKRVLVLPNEFKGGLIPAFKMFEIVRYADKPNIDLINKTLQN